MLALPTRSTRGRGKQLQTLSCLGKRHCFPGKPSEVSYSIGENRCLYLNRIACLRLCYRGIYVMFVFLTVRRQNSSRRVELYRWRRLRRHLLYRTGTSIMPANTHDTPTCLRSSCERYLAYARGLHTLSACYAYIVPCRYFYHGIITLGYMYICYLTSVRGIASFITALCNKG